MNLDFGSVTVGADPELFIVEEDTNKVISSIGLIPGTKDKPYRRGLPLGFGMETDNILAEFNIPPVSIHDCELFTDNITFMQNKIKNYVKKKNKKLSIQCVASREVDEDQLKSKESMMIGCMPDYNVYTERESDSPKEFTSNLRSAGSNVRLPIIVI